MTDSVAEARGARTLACRVGTRADAVFGRRTGVEMCLDTARKSARATLKLGI